MDSEKPEIYPGDVDVEVSDEFADKYLKNNTPFLQEKFDKLQSLEQVELRSSMLLGEVDPAAVRQSLRRIEKFPAAMTQALSQRGTVGTGLAKDEVMYVTLEDLRELKSDPKFIPLSKYINKLIQRNPDGTLKRQLRPIMANEVGIYQDNPTHGRLIILRGM